MNPEFKIKIVDNPIDNNQSFRLMLGDKMIALGNLDTLATFDKEDLCVFLTEILNNALKVLEKDKKGAD